MKQALHLVAVGDVWPSWMPAVVTRLSSLTQTQQTALVSLSPCHESIELCLSVELCCFVADDTVVYQAAV